MENKKELSALIVNAMRLLDDEGQSALCRALLERSEKVREDVRVFLDEIEQQEYNDNLAAAIDAGGGCSRCGDLSGFECICDDEDEYCCEICEEGGDCRNADDIQAYYELYGNH